MQTDLYTKSVLTVIAVCLSWICLHSVDLVPPAIAEDPASGLQEKILPVRIVDFNPKRGWALPINLRELDGEFEPNRTILPVKLVEVDKDLGETDATFSVHVANPEDLKR